MGNYKLALPFYSVGFIKFHIRFIYYYCVGFIIIVCYWIDTARPGPADPSGGHGPADPSGGRGGVAAAAAAKYLS